MATPVGTPVQYHPPSNAGTGGKIFAALITAPGVNDDAMYAWVFPDNGAPFLATGVLSAATWATLNASNPAKAAQTAYWSVVA